MARIFRHLYITCRQRRVSGYQTIDISQERELLVYKIIVRLRN